MSRYIDADRAIESLFDYCNGKKTIGQCIDDTPTEEVKPIVYGEWIHREELFDDEEKPRMVWGCKKCGFSLKSIHDKRNFCPNCGADMRNEREEEE